jgi:hypothetical protein
MKTQLYTLALAVLMISCTTTIPLQTNLSDQTLLLAENRNIKANFTLKSEVSDGYIDYIYVQKNGNQTVYATSFAYGSETAFKKLWTSYFANKFNNYAKDQIDIEVTLLDILIQEQSTMSTGAVMLTGNSKSNVDAIALIQVIVKYHGNTYENKFEVNASDYQESQMMGSGNNVYAVSKTNPTHQKSKLLESCLNRSIIQFENFLRSVMLTEKENN